ncbi:unnamed protein product, partial [Urochloa humidicola]
FPFRSLIQHPLENGSGGAPATSEHSGVLTPVIRSCRRQRPTLSPTILDLTESFRVAARPAAAGPTWLHLEGTARRRILAGQSAAMLARAKSSPATSAALRAAPGAGDSGGGSLRVVCIVRVSEQSKAGTESTTRQACNFSRRPRTSSSPACFPWEVDQEDCISSIAGLASASSNQFQVHDV